MKMIMKKSFLTALLLALVVGANAQDPSKWTKGQEVTEELQWTDYKCDNNESGGWQTKGDNVDLWVSPCFELWANNGTNEAGTEVYQTFFLPAGTYEFHVNGFYRHTGSGGSSLDEIAAGKIVEGAVVFCETGVNEAGEAGADTKEFTKKVADYSTTLTDMRLFERTEEWWDNGDGEWKDGQDVSWFYPQCQAGCVPRFFELNLCDNVLTVVQAKDGYVRLGVRKLVTNANNTVDFANFRAIYLDEPSAGAELILAQADYEEAYEAVKKEQDKYSDYGSLNILYEDAVMLIDNEYGSSTTPEAYKEGIQKLQEITQTYEQALVSTLKLGKLIKLAESVANSTAFVGIDAYKQAVADAKAILADNDLTLVQNVDDYLNAYVNLQKARVDYAMSQEKGENGAWDFTTMVAYPFFVDIESNPTWNEEEGIWQFPETVTRDNVTINQGEFWYDTDGSGWRHYGLEDHAGMYDARHWAGEHWGDMDLAQDIDGLPNGYYSIAGLGLPGLNYMFEEMYLKLTSGDNSIVSAPVTPKTGFYQGASIQDWVTYTTDIIEVKNGTVRVAFCDNSDNNLAFTGMQLFYYGEQPDFTAMIQPLIDAVREMKVLLALKGDQAAVEDILAKIPAQITSMEQYYAAKETVDEAEAYINTASDYLAAHDLTALYAAQADQYADDDQIGAAIEVAMTQSFDIYDAPTATYKDIQAMYADYEAYAHYFQVVKNYQAAGASADLTAKVNEQMTALAQEEDGYADAKQMADNERALAAIANKEAFAKLDIAHASEANPIDVTSFIQNPSFTEGGKYWVGNADMDASVGAAQAYNFTFDVKQTLYSMPSGTYLLCMKGLYRDGTIKEATDHVWAGEGYTPNFQFYANGVTADVVSIANDNAMFTERTFTQYTYESKDPDTEEPVVLKVWVEETIEEVDGIETPVTKYWREAYNSDGVLENMDDAANGWVFDEAFDAGIETIYYPNSTRGAALRFANDEGAYENTLKVTLTEDGDLTIGARKLTTIEGDWCAFDNFRLYYIGAPDPTVAIDDVTTGAAQQKVAAIYGIDGIQRKTLQQGINIVTYANGEVKRVLVK